MSTDTTDDLHYAEEVASRLAAELAATTSASSSVALADWADYCRPTCRYRDEGECYDGDTCGCPCGHDDGRHCPTCGADILGNDPHEPGCETGGEA